MISKDEGLTMIVSALIDKANLARAWMLKPEKQSKAHVGNLSVIVVLLQIKSFLLVYGAVKTTINARGWCGYMGRVIRV